MLGITALSQSPIASLGGTNVNIAVTGLQLTGSVGASTVIGHANVDVTGSLLQSSIGASTVDVNTEVAVTGSQLTMAMGEETPVGNATVSVTGSQLNWTIGTFSVSADGAFIYTGFKPAFVLVKITSGSSDWILQDTKRSTFNVSNTVLYPNDSSSEDVNTIYNLDILSNGFKTRTTHNRLNGSGSTYIYMAFAEAPLVGTNNVPATAR